MSKVYNLEEEEYQTLKQLLKVDKNITNEFGNIARLQLELDRRKENAIKALENFKQQEKVLASTLESKYGNGSIDINNKTFTSND